jgi:hypothetical protein
VLVTTSGAEEGGAAYTRGDAIILPDKVLAEERGKLDQIVAHELFHVISRRDPARRDRLYRVIGFERCPDYVFPPELAARRITNPDAPHNDHRIRIRDGETEVWAIPVLYAEPGRYDPARGGEFFDYLQFRLAVVDAASRGTRLVEVGRIDRFFDQVGRNTKYIIHPEEILADNFALALSSKADAAPAPAIPKAILGILRESGNPRPAD